MTPNARNAKRSTDLRQIALEASRLLDGDYPIDDAEEWDPLEAACYGVAIVEGDKLNVRAEGPYAALEFEGGVFEDPAVDVWYSDRGVYLSLEGKEEQNRSTTSMRVTPDAARELAAALFRAAEEHDRRPSPEATGGN